MLLIYLGSGSNPQGLLKVNGTRLTNINNLTYVIFDQRYKYEGRPFVDANKVFLWIEYAFNDKDLSSNQNITPLFSKACYITAHGIFDEELASYVHVCFQRANALH